MKTKVLGSLFVLALIYVVGNSIIEAQLFLGGGTPEIQGPAPDPISPGGGTINPGGVLNPGNPGPVLQYPKPPYWDNPVLDAPDVNGEVHAIANIGGVVYVGGSFTECGGEPRTNVAAIDIGTREVLKWAPEVNGAVYALEAGNGRVFIGGRFSCPAGRGKQYNNLICVDSEDGSIDESFATAEGTVRALALSSQFLYAGGSFTAIGGEERSCLAAIDLGTNFGEVTKWNPDPDNDVHDILVAPDEALDGGTVYACGTFSHMGTSERSCVAAFSSEGELLPFAPHVDGPVYALTHWYWGGGACFYFGGEFETVEGEPRKNLASVLFTAQPSEEIELYDWAPSPDGKVLGLEQYGTERIAVGEFTTFAGKNRKRVAAQGGAAWGANPPVPQWKPHANDTAYVAHCVPENAVLVVGGSFSWISGFQYTGLAFLPIPLGKTPPEPQIQVSVNGEAFGNGGTFDFEEISLDGGPSQPMTVGISNVGDAPLNVTASGGNTVFNVEGFSGSIPMGGSITFSVTFDPDSVGPVTSGISIGHDANNQPSPFTIGLAGEGVIPATFSQYTTPAMLLQGEPGLQSNNASTVLAARLENELNFDLELTELMLEFELTTGPALLAGALEAVVYIDANANGVLDEPGFSSHVFGEAALTPRIALPAMTNGSRIQMPFSLDVQPQFVAESQANLLPILPAGGFLNLAVEIWNPSAEGGVGMFMGEMVSIPTEGSGQPPVEFVAQPSVEVGEQPQFFGEAPDCELTCASTPWTLCLIPDLSWTQEDDAEIQDCKRDETTLTWDATCEIDEIEMTLSKVGDVADADNDGDPNNGIGDASDKIDASTGISINNNGGMTTASVTIEPIQGSSTCEDCEVSATALFDDAQKKVKNKVSCIGTIFEIRVYPILPNVGCVAALENSIGSTVPSAFTYPQNESPPSDDTGSIGAPEARIDPMTSVGTSALDDALDLLEMPNPSNPSGVITGGYDASCIQSATVTLCSSNVATSNQAITFHYTVLPLKADGSNCDNAPTLTVSQFNAAGSNKGRTAVVIKNNFDAPTLGTSQTDVATNLTGSGSSADIDSDPADPSTGRDVSGVTASAANVGMNDNARFIYLSPLPGAVPAPLEFCNTVVFTVQCGTNLEGIPVAAIQVCGLPPKTLNLCFHFWGNDGRLPAERTVIVDNFVERAETLLGPCCIKPVARPVPDNGNLNHALITINSGPGIPDGLDGNGELTIDGTNEQSIADTVRAQRACDDADTLNIFLFPKGMRDPGTTTILGATFTATGLPPTQLLTPDVTLPDADRFAIISLGTDFDVDDENSAKAVYQGENITCAEVFTHEVAHALGIEHPDFSGVSESEQRERIMRPFVDEDDFSDPADGNPAANFRSPRAQRLTAAECTTIRQNLTNVGAGGAGDWKFNK